MKAPSITSAHPTWASARKDMVGHQPGIVDDCGSRSPKGIVTEVYYPRIDIPQIKDLGFIVADDQGFWVELRRLGNYQVSLPKPGVPAVEIVHHHPRFTFTLRICPSQRCDVLLLHFRLEGDEGLRTYALLSARLGDDAENNIASVATHNGRTVLWAEQGPFALALSAADARRRRCLAAVLGRMPRSQRWLAGLQPQRAHDVAIRQRRAGSRRPDGRTARGRRRSRSVSAPARSPRRHSRCRP